MIDDDKNIIMVSKTSIQYVFKLIHDARKKHLAAALEAECDHWSVIIYGFLVWYMEAAAS